MNAGNELGKNKKSVNIFNLSKIVDYVDDSIVSKVLFNKPESTITVFAFDKAQSLSEHTSPYQAFVQVLDGQARVNIGGEDFNVLPGQMISMPANIAHSVFAEEKFKMMLTMIKCA